MRKIIFLDIDGIFNHHTYFAGPHKGYDYDLHYQKFCPDSKALFNKLIEQTNADIVISSTWRLYHNLDELKHIWKIENMLGNIIDVTPCLYSETKFNAPRGCEIEKWLRNNGFYHCNWSTNEQSSIMEQSDIANYIIIDDDSDMLYNQRNHFVHVLPAPRNILGFSQKYYKIALDKLSKTILELNEIGISDEYYT